MGKSGNVSIDNNGPSLLASTAAFLSRVRSVIRGKQMAQTALHHASYPTRGMAGGDVTRGLRDPARPF